MARLIKVFLVMYVIGVCVLGIASATRVLAETSQTYEYSIPNITKSIHINTAIEGDKMYIDYIINQDFNQDSRGVFLALPKNQNGVLTNYQILSVRKQFIADNDGQKVQSNTVNEPYQIIHEWNQLRFRVGKSDVYLPKGEYMYTIQLLATINPDVGYNFVVLQDWGDQLDELTLNGTTRSEEVNLSVTINPSKPTPNVFHWLWAEYWIVLPILGIAGIINLVLYYYTGYEPKRWKKVSSPEYEPPENILPWQAQYILSEGKLKVKDTLLSYILWLNNKGVITIIPNNEPKSENMFDKVIDLIQKDDKIKIIINSGLPKHILPSIFNETVEQIQTNGLHKGVLESKLSPSTHEGELNAYVCDLLSEYYHIKPAFHRQWLVIAGYTVMGVLGVLVTRYISSFWLIGESYIGLLFVLYLVSFVGTLYVFSKWGKLNSKGLGVWLHSAKYRYYIQYVERFKLNFSNNPTDGVQYYLKQVPYAAMFGLLESFGKYMESINVYTPEQTHVSVLSSSFASLSFYNPDSSVGFSGGGSGGGFSGGGGSW